MIAWKENSEEYSAVGITSQLVRLVIVGLRRKFPRLVYHDCVDF